MVNAIVSGTPSAVPDRPAKLVRMSLRTTPVWLRTVGPFEPFAGNGPAVSSGILLHVAPVVGVVAVGGVLVAAVVGVGVVVGDVGVSELQPMS